MAVVLEYVEPVTHDQVSISPDGLLSLSFGGSITKPQTAYLETTYERVGKRAKVIHRTPLDAAQPSVNPNLALERFGLLLALDTNTGQIGEDTVSITCVVQGHYIDFGPKVVVSWQPKQMLECRNVVGPPENSAWRVVIEELAASARFSSTPVGIIVDSDLGRIPSYNAREIPIIGDFILPPRFELLYASSDTGSEFVANKMIARADQESRALLRKIVEGKIPDASLERIEGCPFSHYRAWVRESIDRIENTR